MRNPSHRDGALRTAAAVAAGFVVLSLAGYVWRPDAGASAPSLLLGGLVVFAFAFTVTYLCRALLGRDDRARAGARARAASFRWAQHSIADGRPEVTTFDGSAFDGPAGMIGETGTTRPADAPGRGSVSDTPRAPRGLSRRPTPRRLAD